MGDALITVSKHRIGSSLLLVEDYKIVVATCSQGLIIINYYCLYYLCMFSIGCKPILTNQLHLANNLA
jgi:hypothetical protein